MTKPKTIKQLLSEANRLARERGMDAVLSKGFCASAGDAPHYGFSVSLRIGIWYGRPYGTGWRARPGWSHAQALRCLIAALREVPVRKGKK